MLGTDAVCFTGDGRLPKSQFAIIIDDEIQALRYSRNGKNTAANETTQVYYLTKGTHTVTVTSPLPLDENDKAVYDYRWINFDCIKFYDGITVSKTQNPPTDVADFVRYEAEEYSMPNLARFSTSWGASGGYVVGSAYYGRAQSVKDIRANGIDFRTTAGMQYTVTATQAGTYKFYIAQNCGIYKEINTTTVYAAVECNGKTEIFESTAALNVTSSRLLVASVELKKGENKVKVSAATIDSYSDAGYIWTDYDYIEVDGRDADKLSFKKIAGVAEAEKAVYSSYTPVDSTSASGGKYLGKGLYAYTDRNRITFDKLDPKNLGEMPHVVYTVIAEKEGDYDIGIQFSGGSLTYTFDEIVAKGTIGFAVAVNGENKQLVEFCPGIGSKLLTVIATVHLKEGVNEILITSPLAEYMSGVDPRVEENYKLYWMDIRKRYNVYQLRRR